MKPMSEAFRAHLQDASLMEMTPTRAAYVIQEHGLEGVFLCGDKCDPQTISGLLVMPGMTIADVLREWLSLNGGKILVATEVVDAVFGTTEGRFH